MYVLISGTNYTLKPRTVEQNSFLHHKSNLNLCNADGLSYEDMLYITYTTSLPGFSKYCRVLK